MLKKLKANDYDLKFYIFFIHFNTFNYILHDSLNFSLFTFKAHLFVDDSHLADVHLAAIKLAARECNCN